MRLHCYLKSVSNHVVRIVVSRRSLLTTGSSRENCFLFPRPPIDSCSASVCKQSRRLRPWSPLRPLRSCSSAAMQGNDASDIIEHHVEEEMEKKGARSHAASSSSFPGSVTPSDRDGHSGTQSSHRLLAYSDALISIIATVMVTSAECCQGCVQGLRAPGGSTRTSAVGGGPSVGIVYSLSFIVIELMILAISIKSVSV